MTEMTLVQAVNRGLFEAMRQDPDVLVLGEDVGVNGGVFRATEGLFKEFGADRVIDTPLSETGIVGTAIGMALYGLKPVAEIQFMDFIYPAFDQIVSELAKFRYRSGGQFPCHVVIRTPYGGGVKGGLYHSQSTEAYFAHTAGLKVVIPSNPADAKGLLLSAIFDPDPVDLHGAEADLSGLDRRGPGRGPPGPVREGVGPSRGERYLRLRLRGHGPADAAGRRAARVGGISAEVIDLRTLVPLDEVAIVRSVEKTGRVAVVHEAARFCGFGAELTALVAERALYSLKAPPVRIDRVRYSVPVRARAPLPPERRAHRPRTA